MGGITPGLTRQFIQDGNVPGPGWQRISTANLVKWMAEDIAKNAEAGEARLRGTIEVMVEKSRIASQETLGGAEILASLGMTML